MRRSRFFTLVITLAPALCFAQPQQLETVAGAGEIVEAGDYMRVRASDRSILHWETFSVGKGESIYFELPAENASCLNRVTYGNPSEIFGSLGSNGKVILINPSGIIVSEDAHVDAASFIGSSHDVLDRAYLHLGELQLKNSCGGSIQNLGVVQTRSGDVSVFIKRSLHHDRKHPYACAMKNSATHQTYGTENRDGRTFLMENNKSYNK